jgi:hypothetical protein
MSRQTRRLIPVEWCPVTFEDDTFAPARFGIGFINYIDRPTHGIDDLTKLEFTEGTHILLRKLYQFRPRVLCFVGYGVYEQFRKLSLSMSCSLSGDDKNMSNGKKEDGKKGTFKEAHIYLKEHQVRVHIHLEKFDNKQRQRIYNDDNNEETLHVGRVTYHHQHAPSLNKNDCSSASTSILAETYLYVVASTSPRCAGIRPPEKVRQFQRLKQLVDQVKLK